MDPRWNPKIESAIEPETMALSKILELLMQAKQNVGNVVSNPKEALSRAVDSAWVDPRTAHTPEGLSKALEVALNFSPGAMAQVKSKNTTPFFKEMQDVAFQPGHPKEQLFNDLNSVLMNHPNDLSFNANTGKIVGSVARDGDFAMKGDRGSYSVKKQDFIDWLYSDKPFDTKVYGDNIKNDSEWIGSIDRLRNALKETK
jgi:hypothetical protein